MFINIQQTLYIVVIWPGLAILLRAVQISPIHQIAHKNLTGCHRVYNHFEALHRKDVLQDKGQLSLQYAPEKDDQILAGSDSRRRYDSVQAKLGQLLPEQWAKGQQRMINLSLLVSAIPKAKDLTQHALAAKISDKDLQAIRDYVVEVRDGLDIAFACFEERGWLIEKLNLRATRKLRMGKR